MPQILVIDDEENFARMLQNLLIERGFQADVAVHPKDAYEMLRQQNYALIVSDYRMPLMDGAAFLKKVRATNPRIPVFLVSGMMNTTELVKVANLGATRVYEKPLDADVFVGQILQFVEPETDSRSWESSPLDGLKKRYLASSAPAYPTPLGYLSDNSPQAVRWIEQLYYGWQQNALGLLVEDPRGEAELAISEMEYWCGSDVESMRLDAVDALLSEPVTARIEEALEKSGPPLLVSVRVDRCLDSQLLERVETWLKNLRSQRIQALHCRVQFFTVSTVDPEQIDRLERALGVRRVAIPPLVGRLPDVVFYLRMHAEQWLPQGFWPHRYDVSLASILLGYSWPGNLSQIDAWLRYLNDNRPVVLNADVFAAFLDSRSEPCARRPFTIETALVEAQRQLFAECSATLGLTTVEVLDQLGFDVKDLPEGIAPEDLDLLFPALIEA